jgi:RNA polymerase-associated protein LEO1
LDVSLFILILLLNILIHPIRPLFWDTLGSCALATDNIMASSSEDDPMDPAEDVEDDLFGDEDDGPAIKERELSDRELDSGDDEDRDDRVTRAAEVEDDTGRDARIMESTIWRHPLPKPFDGEVRFLFINLSTHVYFITVQRPAVTKISWH